MFPTTFLASLSVIVLNCSNIALLSEVEFNKQIMTGLQGNRQIYLPREIQDHLPKSFY